MLDIRYANECWDVMRQAYARRFGQEIPVDVIDGLERAKKILDGPHALARDELWRSLASYLTHEIKAGDPSNE